MRKFALALAGAALFAVPGLFMVEANVGNCGLLACTKKSWANKVRGTADDIAKCARSSFAIPLPTGRFMHRVGTSEEASA